MMILAATDFSDGAQTALARAARIARALEAQLTVVHAFDESTWEGLRSLTKPADWRLREDLHAQLTRALDKTTARMTERWKVKASAVAAHGAPAEAIAATAKAVGASLVVLGVQGADLPRLPFVGSTALKAVRRLRCPVLVVRGRASSNYARCLVGVDFSPSSRRAAAAAAALFTGTSLTLLHAVRSVEGPMIFTGATPAAIRAAHARLACRARKRIAATFARARSRVLGNATLEVVVAPAERALLEALRTGKYDVLALGRDAGATLAERVLGSVASNMLHEAPTDVLIAP